MFLIILKLIITSGIVLTLTEISLKFPKLTGFLAILPSVSLLTLIFSYIQYKDKFNITKFYNGVLIGLPAIFVFYTPFIIFKNFYIALSFGFLNIIIIFFTYRYFELI